MSSGKKASSSSNKKAHLFYRYFKWILWFFSLHLLLHLLSHHPQIPYLPPRINHGSSESTSAFCALYKFPILRHQNRAPQGFLKDLKVYVYDLPSKFNEDWLSNERCNNHLFASKVAIHRALMGSDVWTLDPWEADFFFVLASLPSATSLSQFRFLVCEMK